MSTLVTNHRRSLVGSVLAVFLVLHGIAHFVGVSGNIGSIADNDRVDLLGGAFTTSNDLVFGVLAVAWALLGLGFWVVAVLVWRGTPSAGRALVAVSVASLCVGVMNLWEGVVGLPINAALIAMALLAPQAAGLAEGRTSH
ncbi:hypothetical protein [Nocardioides sp.]|uniref:hypothetical protein n=1 Tax=Nocardioides sp. TaxID=35761 RepID=UPI002736BF90|nr:hypothetical protein [Nocardioides sp.]MDP3892993.1 hypothetical protein [Nocardioides sp.]